MRMHDLSHLIAALILASLSTAGCLLNVPVDDPLVIPPISIREPPPPPIHVPSPDEIAANLPDQCPPSSGQGTSPSFEPQVFVARTGAFPLITFNPDYPIGARDRCTSGWAAFRFHVSKDGSVGAPRLISAHPPGVFDGPSWAALKKSRYYRRSATGEDLLGGCAVFLFHHPLHPLEAETVSAHFPIQCPFRAAPVPTIPPGPFPRGPMEAPLPYPFVILE
jgi:hypothetical protein